MSIEQQEKIDFLYEIPDRDKLWPTAKQICPKCMKGQLESNDKPSEKHPGIEVQCNKCEFTC
jgi:hypothetical protein